MEPWPKTNASSTVRALRSDLGVVMEWALDMEKQLDAAGDATKEDAFLREAAHRLRCIKNLAQVTRETIYAHGRGIPGPKPKE